MIFNENRKEGKSKNVLLAKEDQGIHEVYPANLMTEIM